jgi:SAM-dependent methyltransferase
MYDTFSADYDRFVNWSNRLAFELPFVQEQLKKLEAGFDQAGSGRTLRILDAACGTGMHAIALAQLGYRAAGADISTGMIERARLNAAQAGVEVEFQAAGFGELASSFANRGLLPFDALLCLGNSLPHLLRPAELAAALADFAACLRPGGLLLIQNRNFDAVLAQRSRWMEPQSHQEGEREWVFLRFYDFLSEELIHFNILTLRRTRGEAWEQQVISTPLKPLRLEEMSSALRAAGFGSLFAYGDLSGGAFDPAASGNLVMAGIKED